MSREPGVELIDSIRIPSPFELPSAVPVFIGAGLASCKLALGLHAMQSSEQWRAAWDQKEALEQTLKSPLYHTVQHYFDSGGGSCFVLRLSAAKTLAELSQQAEHYVPILSEPTISLVALPELGQTISQLVGDIPVKELTSLIAQTHIDVWKAVLSACSGRSDLFFIFDAPRELNAAKECIHRLRIQGGLGERGQYAALYGPYLRTDYTLEERSTYDLDNLVVVPPCGAVAHVIQHTDQTFGVWKAPANVALTKVVQPEYQVGQMEAWFDATQMSINTIRSFPGRGIRVWGCRTLASAAHSSFCYVQVRRLMTYIGANLTEICRFAVFEPNSEITWCKLKGLMNAWLRKLWQRGGLAGSEENQAFEILLGLNESMSAADIKIGRMIVKTRVAVLRAAEFIDVTLILNMNQDPFIPTSPQINVSIF